MRAKTLLQSWGVGNKDEGSSCQRATSGHQDSSTLCPSVGWRGETAASQRALARDTGCHGISPSPEETHSLDDREIGRQHSTLDRSPEYCCACVWGAVSLCGDMSPRDVELAHPDHSMVETKPALPPTWRGRGQCRGLRNPCRRSIWALGLRIWCGSQTTSATS